MNDSTGHRPGELACYALGISEASSLILVLRTSLLMRERLS